MPTTISRVGFGQVEPNHLSAQRTAQIYAQLPAASTINILENGQFVKYDYLNKEVNFTGAGEWMLIYNEVKLYDDAKQNYKDFAMINTNYAPNTGFPKGEMVPRVFKTNVGDIYTTNCIGGANTSDSATYAGISVSEGDVLSPDANGYLVASGGDTSMQWQVVKIYTMPDNQVGVKLRRIA
jgi:hypothetical protein